MTQGPIQVNSEIGRLKTVLLKRPGKELENLVPITWLAIRRYSLFKSGARRTRQFANTS